MSKTKKILAVVVALVMAMALCVPAFGNFIVKNAVPGETYTIYRLFYADGNAASGAAKYYIDSQNTEWLAAVQSADSPFALTPVSNGVYSVEAKDGITDEDIIDFVEDNIEAFGTPIEASFDSGNYFDWDPANSGSANANYVVASEEYMQFGSNFGISASLGYYYMTSTTGTKTLFTYLGSTLGAGDFLVYDKSITPGPGPDDPDDPDSDEHYKQIVNFDGIDTSANPPHPTYSYAGQTASYDYGSTVYYKLSCATVRYDVDTKITEYVAHDVPGEGLSRLNFMYAEIIDENGTTDITSAVTASTDNGEITVTVPWVDSSDNFLYSKDAVLNIYLQGAIDDSGENYTNEGFFTWTGRDVTDIPDEEKDIVTIETRNITVDPQDSTAPDAKLIGKYVLKNEDGKYYKYDPASHNVTWVNDVANATKITSDSPSSEPVFKGVADGTYYVEEVQTPHGYNPLEDPQEVVVNGADATAVINYGAGAQLPSTGAAGTIAFIGIGSLLAIGAGLFLVTNARMKKENTLG